MKKFRRGVVAASLVLGIGATAAPAGALPANQAAELCRQFDEEGLLELLGLTTRGECVNILKGPASENANNFIAAVCGFDSVQSDTGTTNKGQCIKVLRG